MDRRIAERKAILGLAVFALALSVCQSSAQARAVDEFRQLPDNRLAIRESLGLRSARALDVSRVEVILGIGPSKACQRAESYRIVSFQDADYAYEKFVKPVSAAARSELEVRGPAGCRFASFDRTLVILTLPRPMKSGSEYFVIAQGSGGQPVTGGRTARASSTAGRRRPGPRIWTVRFSVCTGGTGRAGYR